MKLRRNILLLVTGIVFSFAAYAETAPLEMVVSLKDAKTLTVRSAPNAESAAVAFVENGKSIIKKGSEDANGFVMVQLSDGRSGWTKASFLARPQTVPAQAANVANAAVVIHPVASASVVPQALPLASSPRPIQQPASRPDVPHVAELPHVAQQASVAAPVFQSPRAEPAGGKTLEITRPSVLMAGIVGLLVGLVVGGKSGMMYATKSIHERYEVIG